MGDKITLPETRLAVCQRFVSLVETICRTSGNTSEAMTKFGVELGYYVARFEALEMEDAARPLAAMPPASDLGIA
jgi:hypothetical protein